MTVDYLVIGQGICGSFLCYELQKAGQSFVVLDDERGATASRVASGIINPVTGRRIVKTWMIDELMPFAQQAYQEIGLALGIPCISPVSIMDFFPTPQMRLAFLNRLEETPFLSLPKDEYDQLEYFNYNFGYGLIHPCLLVDVPHLLDAFRNLLNVKNLLRKETFEHALLKTEADHIEYKDIIAKKIIFCDGISSVALPWFRNLPFAPNKGEALLVEIKDLKAAGIFKKGISIVPWKDGLHWVGASHQWQFDDEAPSEAFRVQTMAQLKSFSKLPFRLVDHWAAVRPATLERRPFAGFHPLYPSVGILNGMGTKGCSLAPYFARQLVDHLTKQTTLLPEADISRFRNVLSRS